MVLADVEITDVMYDPPGNDTGHEWIEITNKGTESVNVAAYKFREGGVNHKLTIASGTSTLPAGASAIIASDPSTYASDHPSNTESVFKSSFSLSNTGEVLALVDASGTTAYTMSYTAPPKSATPAPTKTPTKSITSSKPKTTSTNTSANTSTQTTSKAATNTASIASAGVNIPPVLGWAAGLAAVVSLGIVGVLYMRQQRTRTVSETPKPGAEFELE